MLYSDLIRQETEYTYSANVQFDIENDKNLLDLFRTKQQSIFFVNILLIPFVPILIIIQEYCTDHMERVSPIS